MTARPSATAPSARAAAARATASSRGCASTYGFKRLVLDNLYNDASFLREQLAFAVFAELGITVPRAVAHLHNFITRREAIVRAILEGGRRRSARH